MADFSDIKEHWAKDCIEKLAEDEIISGYEDGTFKPDNSVTRAEFAAMLNKAFPNQPEIRQGIEFGDVDKDYWAYEVIQKAYRTGFLSGYQDKTFKPAQKIPRVQALVALSSGLKLDLIQPIDFTLEKTYLDSDKIPDYAKRTIAAATENGLVVNYPDVNYLKPEEFATRGEITTFLSQALLKANEESSVPDDYLVKAVEIDDPTGEIRGVWLTNIDSDVLLSATSVVEAIDSLSQLKFNTLYPVVWNRGYTQFPSQVMKRIIDLELDPAPGLAGRDVLQEIITQAKAKSMSVMPWFEFGFMVPQDSKLLQSRPNWITTNQEGIPFVKEDDKFRVWLNPFNPQVQQFILDLVVEVVTKYDVNGIQFDDHFGLPVELGYDEFTTQLYQRENGGQLPPTDPNDPDWVKWRADKITDFMMRLFWVVKDYKPNCIISLSPNPKSYAYDKYLQDWPSWERYGFVEELVLQVYRNDPKAFKADLEAAEVLDAKVNIPVAIGILTGLKNQPVQLSTVKDQIAESRRRKFAGVSFFFYETLKSLTATEEGKTAFVALFPDTIERPEIIAASLPSVTIPELK
ncbi:glycoside hydrolase family 10 protein [Capilliphycus salinus ALCB114379]|uniref:glycoside hydrolase family 10 protein n=1 Tax=Capilliphycus salinus TaxID=2768948 RepID=UPI0039A7233D